MENNASHLCGRLSKAWFPHTITWESNGHLPQSYHDLALLTDVGGSAMLQTGEGTSFLKTVKGLS
jgi:hypothetical protein